jgi:glycosyltransferase involved in cell wall biosynthesis
LIIKKLLIVTAFPPCQKTAGEDYTRRLIEDLIAKNYKVDLIYSEYAGHAPELPKSVRIIDVIHPTIFNCLKSQKFHPFFTKRFDKRVLKHIQKIADNYDLLYFDFSQVMIYSMFVKHTCKVLMSHDVIWQKYSRKSGILKAIEPMNVAWIKETEGKVLQSGSSIVTFSNKDCNLISMAYNLPSKSVNFYLKRKNFSYDGIEVNSNVFCFYGSWNRYENSEAIDWFIDNVYSKVTVPIKYLVIGGGMSDELKEKLSKYINFSLTGFVDDPVKVIASCQALIAPLHYGAGVKVKVVDALTSGTPVIGTNVAFEGLEEDGEGLLYHAESKEKVIDLLNNWQQIGASDKQIMAKKFFDYYECNHFTDLLPIIGDKG